jgi:DNA-binding XRE family transcriptional regulator
MKTFREHLKCEMEDEEFKRIFKEEKQRLRIAYDIYEARLEKRMTQAQLANASGTTQQMISRVENAYSPKMSLKTIQRIGEALGKEVRLV